MSVDMVMKVWEDKGYRPNKITTAELTKIRLDSGNVKFRELDAGISRFYSLVSSSYKGGRSECFAYGSNKTNH